MGGEGRGRYRKQKDADLFDGRSIELDDYLEHFERVAMWNGFSYEEKGIHLALSLRGVAQQILRELPIGQKYYGD